MASRKGYTSQKTRVKNYILQHGSITSLEAFTDLGCTRLSAAIYLLRKEGENIISEDATVTNRYGQKVTFSRYMYSTEEE